MKVDVIIPTYKPDKGFPEMIKRLEKQTLKPKPDHHYEYRREVL